MLKCWGFWNFTLFLKKILAICPCFQTILGRAPVSKLNFIKIELCPIKLKQKNAWNSSLGRSSSKTPLQGFKTSLQDSMNLVQGDHTLKKKKKLQENVTIGLPEPGIGQSHLFFKKFGRKTPLQGFKTLLYGLKTLLQGSLNLV